MKLWSMTSVTKFPHKELQEHLWGNKERKKEATTTNQKKKNQTNNKKKTNKYESYQNTLRERYGPQSSRHHSIQEKVGCS